MRKVFQIYSFKPLIHPPKYYMFVLTYLSHMPKSEDKLEHQNRIKEHQRIYRK